MTHCQAGRGQGGLFRAAFAKIWPIQWMGTGVKASVPAPRSNNTARPPHSRSRQQGHCGAGRPPTPAEWTAAPGAAASWRAALCVAQWLPLPGPPPPCVRACAPVIRGQSWAWGGVRVVCGCVTRGGTGRGGAVANARALCLFTGLWCLGVAKGVGFVWGARTPPRCGKGPVALVLCYHLSPLLLALEAAWPTHHIHIQPPSPF